MMATRQLALCLTVMVHVFSGSAFGDNPEPATKKPTTESAQQESDFLWVPLYSNSELAWRKDEARERMTQLIDLENRSELETEFLFWIRHTHRLFQALLVERMMCHSRLQLGLVPPTEIYDPSAAE